MVDLGALGGRSLEAWFINDAGYVIGRWEAAQNTFRTFVWTATTGMVDLGSMGAVAINNAGVIAGSRPHPSIRNASQAAVWKPYSPTIDDVTAQRETHSNPSDGFVTFRVDYTVTTPCGHTTWVTTLSGWSHAPRDASYPNGVADIIVVDPHTIRPRAGTLPNAPPVQYTIQVWTQDSRGRTAAAYVPVSVLNMRH